MTSSKKKKSIEIIPENAEFEEVRSLGEESLGDESLSEDAGNDKGTSGQEEMSRKKKGDSFETQQSNQPYQKKQRQKKARCWLHLDVITENNQKITICQFCKTRMKCGSTGCITTLNRHVDKCLATHGRKNQTLLQFQPSDSLSSEMHVFIYSTSDLGFKEYVPSPGDWERVEGVCSFLEVFSDVTKVVSGSEYSTSNLFLSEIRRVKQIIDIRAIDSNMHIREMARKMELKFEKYWGETNLVMSIGAVLDPRFKLILPKFCFPALYPIASDSENFLSYLRNALTDLYLEYCKEDKDALTRNESSEVSSSDANFFNEQRETPKGINDFESFIRESGGIIEPTKSELEEYLSENIIPPNSKFDALAWWKANASKFPVLSNMASDVLSIPISTVASESTFSAVMVIFEPCAEMECSSDLYIQDRLNFAHELAYEYGNYIDKYMKLMKSYSDGYCIQTVRWYAQEKGSIRINLIFSFRFKLLEKPCITLRVCLGPRTRRRYSRLASGSVWLSDVLSSILKIWGVQSPKEGTKHLAVEFVIALAKARVRAPRMMSKGLGYADKHTCSCMYQMPWTVSRYLYTKVLRFLNCRHIFSPTLISLLYFQIFEVGFG
ncbi:hypothetical protein POM88_010701 [Heracleum sosnowskyi]|uniref:BED-type domain-containing protein n=1 Tax=Heracleum sosnowskyi TaxID=360622 RepID=A0AAD8IWZ6_9APIA|nr:hypothetical protein POM88_010701 [Heracleum sosnowskyi]